MKFIEYLRIYHVNGAHIHMVDVHFEAGLDSDSSCIACWERRKGKEKKRESARGAK
jgi:hypothetical protein